MSNRIPQSDHGINRRTRKPVHPYQSAWMSHWVPTSSSKAHGHLSPNCEFKKDIGDAMQHVVLGGPQMETSDIKLVEEFRGLSEAKRIDIVNEMRPGELNIQPFNVSNMSHHKDCNMDSSNNQDSMCHRETLKSQIDLNYVYNPVTHGSESQLPLRHREANSERDFLLGGNYFPPEGKSCNPELESCNLYGKSILAFSTSFQDNKGSSSKIVPYGFTGEGASMESLMVRQEKCNQSAPMFPSKVDFVDKCQSTLFIHGKRSENPSGFKRSGASLISWNGTPVLPNDCLRSDCQLPVFASKCEKMPNDPSSKLSLTHSFPPTMVNETEKLYPGCYSLPIMPSSADVETMRICKTLDSVQEFSSGVPNFSQTARNFLITKETDINMSEKCQLFRESTVSLKLKGKMFTEFLNSSPDFDFHCQHAVKVQPVGSSIESEGKEYFGDITIPAVCVKNESSAETDIMDMDVFERNHISGIRGKSPIQLGVALSSLNKDTIGGKNPSTSLAAVASVREDVGSGLLNTELAAINPELMTIPGRESSAYEKETTTSRTQSLDVEHLLSNAEQPTSTKSGACLRGCLEDELGSRWVKRLKRSVSDSFGHGTKILKIGQTCSVENVHKYSSKSWNCKITSSEPTNAKYAKADILDHPGTFSKEEITLSHPWIRRWCHNKAVSPEKKSERVFEPQSSKEMFDEFQKKQFPSIAAMALVGKAMNGFSPCEIRKSGSVIVWNTKGF